MNPIFPSILTAAAGLFVNPKLIKTVANLNIPLAERQQALGTIATQLALVEGSIDSNIAGVRDSIVAIWDYLATHAGLQTQTIPGQAMMAVRSGQQAVKNGVSTTLGILTSEGQRISAYIAPSTKFTIASPLIWQLYFSTPTAMDTSSILRPFGTVTIRQKQTLSWYGSQAIYADSTINVQNLAKTWYTYSLVYCYFHVNMQQAITQVKGTTVYDQSHFPMPNPLSLDNYLSNKVLNMDSSNTKLFNTNYEWKTALKYDVEILSDNVSVQWLKLV